jgi:hypothetical protein
MIDRYQQSGLLKNAALVARFFRIDPVVVVRSSWKDYALRTAAYRYAAAKEAEESKRQAAAKAAKK